MKIYFLSTVSPFDRNSWSGITYNVFQILKESHEVLWSGKPVFDEFRQIEMKLQRTVRRVLRQKFTDQNTKYSKALSIWIRRELIGKNYDCIVVGSGEPELVACLDTDLPIIYIADSTFHLKLDYYPWHSGLSKKFKIQGEEVEQRAIERSQCIIYSSKWAAESAIHHYSANPNKIKIIPYGPNLIEVPETVRKYRGENLNLLFIGKQWIRKGGSVALDVFLQLKAKFPCTLTVLGCDSKLPIIEGLTVIPFLNKNMGRQAKEYSEVLSRAHLLLLPTFADCTPVVFSDAAAFGIPIITRDTGGISSIVINGENGICLPYESEASDFANNIFLLWNDKLRYEEMAVKSRVHFETKLNWKQWSSAFRQILSDLES